MKRKVIIPLVVFLAILGIGAAIKYRPHTVPWEECSEVYCRYATTDGIRASYIKDYRVNDTITLNVTLLEATDSAGWDTMKNHFQILEPENNIIDDVTACGRDALTLLRLNKTQNALSNNDLVVASMRDKYICIFHTKDSADNITMLNIIFDVILNSLTNNQSLKNEENN